MDSPRDIHSSENVPLLLLHSQRIVHITQCNIESILLICALPQYRVDEVFDEYFTFSITTEREDRFL